MNKLAAGRLELQRDPARHRRPGLKQRRVDAAAITDYLGDGDRLPERAPEPQHRGRRDARRRRGKDDAANNLPPGRPQRGRPLLQLDRYGQEQIATERAK